MSDDMPRTSPHKKIFPNASAFKSALRKEKWRTFWKSSKLPFYAFGMWLGFGLAQSRYGILTWQYYAIMLPSIFFIVVHTNRCEREAVERYKSRAVAGQVLGKSAFGPLPSFGVTDDENK